MTDGPQDNPEHDDTPEPVHGQVRHSNVSARVPEGVGEGVFSNGVMILTGPFEIVLDFVLRLGEQQRVVSRVVMPRPVAQQFETALHDNIGNFEKRFGKLPAIPTPVVEPSESSPKPAEGSAENQAATPKSGEGAESSKPAEQQRPPQIDEIYDELKFPDELLSGHYANAVLIRHSATEFCFDFITNVYPRSAVSARVFLAVPHGKSFLASLSRSLGPPGTSQGMT